MYGIPILYNLIYHIHLKKYTNTFKHFYRIIKKVFFYENRNAKYFLKKVVNLDLELL